MKDRMRSPQLTSPGVQPLRSLALALIAAGCVLLRAPVVRADTPSPGTTPATTGTPSSAPANATAGTAKSTAKNASKTAQATPMKPYYPGSASRQSHRGEQWNTARFGIEQMHVRSVSSGSSIEFRYRVVDADKAAVLTDRNSNPYLIDQETGIRLDVPVMEKIGALRQTSTPKAGREYWMMFANRTKSVKPGQRVDIFCGSYHIRGLTVE
jgi:hypothetical protein